MHVRRRPGAPQPLLPRRLLGALATRKTLDMLAPPQAPPPHTRIGWIYLASVVARSRTVETSSLRQSVDATWLDQATCEVSIVFPCLNEESGVGECVKDADARLTRAGIAGEVIVCDNGSSDGSETAAARAGARVVHEPSRGYGSALRTGIRAAQGEYIVILDADGSYGPRSVRSNGGGAACGPARTWSWVTASKVTRRTHAPWAHRYVGSPLLSGLLNLFFGTGVGDVHCGMRAFTRGAYHRLALKTTGMEFASEMVARAARIRLKIAEVPVDYHPRAGASKLRRYRDGWRHLRFLLMYSPTWLYMIPSAPVRTRLRFADGTADVAAQFLAASGDMHLAAIASNTVSLATQCLAFGISARTFCCHPRLRPGGPLYQWLLQPIHA